MDNDFNEEDQNKDMGNMYFDHIQNVDEQQNQQDFEEEENKQNYNQIQKQDFECPNYLEPIEIQNFYQVYDARDTCNNVQTGNINQTKQMSNTSINQQSGLMQTYNDPDYNEFNVKVGIDYQKLFFTLGYIKEKVSEMNKITQAYVIDVAESILKEYFEPFKFEFIKFRQTDNSFQKKDKDKEKLIKFALFRITVPKSQSTYYLDCQKYHPKYDCVIILNLAAKFYSNTLTNSKN